MLYKYTPVQHPETQDFYNSIKKISIRLWRNRNSIHEFSLTDQLFTDHQIEVLRRSRKFRELVRIFINAWLALDTPEKKLVIRAFVWENDVSKRLNNIHKPILCKTDLDETIRKPAKKLFYYLYDERFRKNYLNNYYPLFYNAHRHRFCPFCGLEKIPAPNSIKKREYDHILPKSIYPFASVNLDNLAPACSVCNEDAKKSKDIIHFQNGEGNKQRRVYDYVYDHDLINIDIRLEVDTEFPDASGNNSNWHLSILPNEDKTIAWNETFCVRQRYIEVLEENYYDWLNGVLTHCINNNARTEDEIVLSIKAFASCFSSGNVENMENILRIRFYELIANRTESVPFQTIYSVLNPE